MIGVSSFRAALSRFFHTPASARPLGALRIALALVLSPRRICSGAVPSIFLPTMDRSREVWRDTSEMRMCPRFPGLLGWCRP